MALDPQSLAARLRAAPPSTRPCRPPPDRDRFPAREDAVRLNIPNGVRLHLCTIAYGHPCSTGPGQPLEPCGFPCPSRCLRGGGWLRSSLKARSGVCRLHAIAATVSGADQMRRTDRLGESRVATKQRWPVKRPHVTIEPCLFFWTPPRVRDALPCRPPGCGGWYSSRC